MQIRFVSNFSSKPPGALRRVAALIVTAAVVGLALMFGVVLLVALVLLGTMGWAYLWWKTRELRKMMRNFSSSEERREATASNDAVFEGEVIRVVEPHDTK